ncbi:hypothetical protein [Streptomyces sp. YS415]|uniref:hypothetical protein n=1 Tax=Streptomyces sp. YS415 TaxID=2944806 RepID=UPI002020E0D1|nr:hypothetical protein [Streptomyces sp. YS415]MCL7427133.1 hypothetical protein [Streptomyces sp. YS415]
MFDDLPPDLDRLQTLRVWHALWVDRIDARIAALRQRQAEEARGRQRRPAPPDWVAELGIGFHRDGPAGMPPLPARHPAGHPRLSRSSDLRRVPLHCW